MKPHVWFVRAMSRLVPYRWRAEWKQEWDAELDHRESLGRANLLRHSLGSFWDALAMQPRRLEEEVFQDLRFGIRMFAKNKALTLTAIFSLALGIGANTAIFSMVDAVLLKKLPVKNPDELILFEWNGGLGGAITSMTSDRNLTLNQQSGDTFSYRAFDEFRARTNSLADVFAFAKPYTLTLIADDQAEIVSGQWVSGNFFSGLGVEAALGRTITPDDDKPSPAPAAAISYRYWKRRFALDPAVLGKMLLVNNVPFTITGVTASDFSGTLQVNDAPDVFLPIALEPTLRRKRSSLTNPNWAWIYVMARTKPGITPAQAAGSLQGIFDEVNKDAAANAVRTGGGLPPDTRPFEPGSAKLGFFSGSRGLIDNRLTYEQPLLILMILVGVVLVVACANVANLLLARASTRHKEIAVRLAMGAGRLRLVRQVLTESVLLAACGGACGAILAYFTKDLLLQWGPWSNAANPITLKLDLRVLAFTVAVSVMTGILFGLAPAFASTRRDISSTMKGTARTVSAGRSYAGKTLLVVQVALSLVLLIGAGLFVRTMHNLHSVVSAYDPDHVLQFDVDPSLMNYEYGKIVTVLEQMVERIESIPGVRAATVTSGGTNFGTFDDKLSGRAFAAQFQYVRENYFETLGVPLLMGKGLTASDRQGTPPVLMVNEAFVHKYFPNTSAVGKTAGGEIVGVVRDAKIGRLRQEPGPAMYFAYRQRGGFAGAGRMTFRVRTDVEPMSVFPAVRDALQKIDSHLPIANARSMTDGINLAYARENMFAGLSTLFGTLALILTCVGFYGIIAYSVARRTNEIGVRIALGAKRFDVLRLVMSEGLFLVIAGIGFGVGGALASGRYIQTILFGLAPDDGVTIILAISVMIAIALLAAFLPARKASRVDPLTALRDE